MSKVPNVINKIKEDIENSKKEDELIEKKVSKITTTLKKDYNELIDDHQNIIKELNISLQVFLYFH